MAGTDFDAVHDGAAPAFDDADAGRYRIRWRRAVVGEPAVDGARCDGANQGVQYGEGGVDFGGALLEPGEDVAAGVGRDGQQVTQVQTLVGEDAGGVVTAGVDDHAVAQGEVDDLTDVRTDGGQLVGVGHLVQGGAGGQDPAAEQPVSGGVLVQPQQGFLDAQCVRVDDGVADVVAQGADVADVVVEAFQFQQDRAHPAGFDGYLQVQGVLNRAGVGQGVADGGVAGDAFGQRQPSVDVAVLEEFLDALMDVPEAGFEFEDGLADDGEPEVAGFDQPGVYGADGDLVHAWTLHGEERERLVGVAELWWRAGV